MIGWLKVVCEGLKLRKSPGDRDLHTSHLSTFGEINMTKINDNELRRKVIAELDWDPSIDNSTIGVAVKDGIVTLSGSAVSYAQKKNAERAVKRVAGVRAVAEDLQIKLPGSAQRSDADVAQSVVAGLRVHVDIPYEHIQATVEHGWVKIDGEVEWQNKKVEAENAIKYLLGVKGVTDNIRVKPRVSAADVKTKIESAFARRAHTDANRIRVEASDSRVTLRGSVDSWDERERAEQAAWGAPGVSKVENYVTVMSEELISA
jgi:osmotically-inducible protein OsmY